MGLNSGNSSKPPSSDGLKKPSAKENRRTRSQRDTSNRKSGGQPGHKGTTLKQVKNPDKITDHFPPRCQACEAALSPEKSIRSVARQVFDLPPPPPLIVTDTSCPHLRVPSLRCLDPSRLSRRRNISRSVWRWNCGSGRLFADSALHPREAPGAVDFGYLRHQDLSGNAG